MLRILLGAEFPLPLDRPFTRAQALAAGLSPSALTSLVQEGLLRRPLRGVYVAAQAPDTQLLRARALQLVVPSGSVVTDESAGWLAGAAMILPPGAHLEPPRLTVFVNRQHRRLSNGLVASGSRQLLARDVACVHGVLATTPLRTALDLGRLRPRDRALAALDQLLRLGVFTPTDLFAEMPRFRGMRGVRQLRALAAFADGRSESPGESALRLRCSDLGLPPPVVQPDILDDAGRFLGRADLLIEELRLILEYDGERWHGPEHREHDEARRAAFARASYTVGVFRRSDLYGSVDAGALLLDHVRRARLALSRRGIE